MVAGETADVDAEERELQTVGPLLRFDEGSSKSEKESQASQTRSFSVDLAQRVRGVVAH